MSFVKDDRNRRRSPTGQPRFVLPPLLASPIVRLVAFALAAAIAAVWALVYHYTREVPPMRVPVAAPRAAPTFDPDAGEMPVPELAPWDGG